ncbi:MAG: cytochrome c3 family protein [Candidatus Solibacter usitatus]|nr:cytochrome c3 family protein [Candidatus Solibacter usitatus]
MRHLILILMAGVVCAQTVRKASPAKPGHPEVGVVTGDCLSCHRDTSREVVADWEASTHGSRGVVCIACHEALGPAFVRRPAEQRCVACHGEMVKALATPPMKGTSGGPRTCFSCHAPHSLSPHKSLWHPDVSSKGGKRR